MPQPARVCIRPQGLQYESRQTENPDSTICSLESEDRVAAISDWLEFWTDIGSCRFGHQSFLPVQPGGIYEPDLMRLHLLRGLQVYPANHQQRFKDHHDRVAPSTVLQPLRSAHKDR